MKTKTLERQCRDLGELITQLQDTHSEIKVAIIKGDLGTASMHAHELADDMACFAKDDAIQMAQAIDSYQDDDEEGDDHDPRAHAKTKLHQTADKLGIELVFKAREDGLDYMACQGLLQNRMGEAAKSGCETFTIEYDDRATTTVSGDPTGRPSTLADEEDDIPSEAEARKQLMQAAQEAGIELVVKTVDKEDAIEYTECVGHLIGQMKRAAENGAEEFTLEVDCPWGGGDDDPAAQGEAAATADALRAELAVGAGRLANKSIQLHKAWDEAGYSEDDAVREDLLVVAAQILGALNVADGNSNPDHTFMRNLAKMAEELAANLDVIATDLEPEA